MEGLVNTALTERICMPAVRSIRSAESRASAARLDAGVENALDSARSR
jgi:hypothetical protein